MKAPLLPRSGATLATVAAAVLLGASSLHAQQATVTGRVTDAQGGQPVASVQVYLPDLDIGVLTQQNGRYLLQNVPAGTHTLAAERIGYRTVTQEVTVGAGETVVQNFDLSEEALQLDEVIVTGTPGGTQRRALGNSVERLQASEITERAPVGNVQNLLAARTPGLRFGGLDGQVGGGRGITIRGISSVSLGAQPLIYVDGVRVENDATRGPDTGSGNNASAINDLNPEEIESIEVVKGPAAATLYGTEASAGVIQIITKRGAVGEPEFTFEVAQGTNFMMDPAGVLGTQYACAERAAVCPDDQIVAVNMYEEASDYLRREGRFADVPGEARDEDLFNYGSSQRYGLSVRGGTEQVRYYLSGTWSDDTGVVDYNTDTSTSLRGNVTVLLSENLNLDVSTGYTQGDTRFATVSAEGGVWHQLVWSRPYNLPGVRSESGSGFLGFQERFPESYEKTNLSRDYSRFTGSMTTTHNYSDWLTNRLTFGVDKGWEMNTEYLPGEADFPAAPQGQLEYGRPVSQRITFDYAASAEYQVTEGLGTTTSAGARYYSTVDDDITNSGAGFPTVVQTVIDQTEFGERDVSYSHIENKTLGFFVQEQISWEDRIFLTGAISADDNSAFGSQFDLQYYPNAQASWVVSQEEFFNIDAVSSLRLRGAWGKAGRQPSTFAGTTLYGTLRGPNGNGLRPTQTGNPEIGPEVTTEWELGFDIALLEDRLSGQFSYYNTETSDLLVEQDLEPSFGLPGERDANLGEMTTQGWEASIDMRLLEGSSVAFDLAMSGDYTTNEITSLGEDVLPGGNFQIGWPYPNVATDYFIRSAEFEPDGRGVTNVMCDGGRPARPGGPNIMPGGETIPCSDYDEEGILLGASYPSYSFSVSPTLSLYQDIQLFAVAEGQYGRWIASTDANYACRYYRNCLQSLKRDDPIFVAATSTFIDDRYNGRYESEFWRLRQLGVRYTLPQGLVEPIGADRASLSASGNNLWVLWQGAEADLSGNPIYDPEYANPGNTPSQTALWQMPAIASFNASLRVTF